MKVKCIDNFGCGKLTLGKIYTVINEKEEYYKVKNDVGIELLHYKNRFEIVKEGNKMGKTFKEVIADIKEGETWIQKDKGYIVSKIANFGGDIVIELDSSRSVFGTKGTYTLERKEYSFDEAFKAYEEGKEIESEDGFIYKKINGQDCVCSDEARDWVKNDEGFYVKEIRGKWYIND